MENKDFSSLITNAVAERMQPEHIEGMVLERVDKLITGAIDDAFRSYSDTAKTIETAVKEALKVNRIDLPSYGETVAAILKTQIENNVSEVVSGKLSEQMEELLSLAPKEVKLSEIAEFMLEDKDDDYYDQITVIVDHKDNNGAFIYLDKNEANATQNMCDIFIGVDKDGIIYQGRTDHRNLKDSGRFGQSWGLDQRIRAYYACGTKIIIDEDEVSLCKGAS